ncbi:MAG: hypothetical protein HKN35_14270 [Woeseia sp.]|nr:DUF177 domain-containing protein [Woeseia sp.]MBT8097088.1 DUF177 domain-containing protein [Woeseia sp.]NNE62056.1 hypothetical protein [Woeseia sp.]NNL53667.1 hypothetical protein [Woeseia sp.]
MANPLLLRAKPEFLARRKQVIESIEKLSSFKRLAAIVAQDLGALDTGQDTPDFRALPVTVKLEFGWADARERWPKVQGMAAARLPAVCQRCLELCEIEVSANINVMFLQSSDTRSADEALEIWELEQDSLVPRDLVEEMLVMAMPLAAKHARIENCGASLVASDDATSSSQDKVRPFANLKKQIEQSR